MKSILGSLVLFIALLLAGCGSPPTSDQPRVATSLAATSVAQISVPAAQSADPLAPTRVVSTFLSSLSIDPSGKTAVQYLGSDLRAEVEGGKPIPAILGVQDIFKSYVVTPAKMNDGGDAVVRATLVFDQPVKRDFSVRQQDGTWHIVAVVAVEPEASATATPSDAAKSEAAAQAVVESFLRDYQQGKTPEQLARYASEFRRAQMPAGGLLAMLKLSDQTINDFSVTSSRVAANNAAVTVVLDAGGMREERVFTLSLANGANAGWYIDNIDVPHG